MRKEQIVAIFLGSLIGITSAFLLWRSVRNQPKQDIVSPDVVKEDSSKVVTGLSLTSPTDQAVLTGDIVNVEGLAAAGSTVVVTTDKVYLTKADASGKFSTKIELAAGVNYLKVWAFAAAGVPQSQNLMLIYTSKIEESNEPHISLIGTLTDIAIDTIQIKNGGGEIKQISISQSTSYGSIVDDPKEISFSDLAIGDYVAALGHLEGSKVFSASRILVTTESEPNYTTAVFGSIKELSSEEFLLTEGSTNQEISIEAKGKVAVYSAKEEEISSVKLMTAKSGDQIVVFGTYEDDELIASTIIIL